MNTNTNTSAPLSSYKTLWDINNIPQTSKNPSLEALKDHLIPSLAFYSSNDDFCSELFHPYTDSEDLISSLPTPDASISPNKFYPYINFMSIDNNTHEIGPSVYPSKKEMRAKPYLSPRQDVLKRFEDFIEDLFGPRMVWSHGSAQAFLSGGTAGYLTADIPLSESSDVDIYLYGPKKDDMVELMYKIIELYRENKGVHANKITLIGSAVANFGKLQFIFNNALSPETIVARYDFSHVQVYYDGKEVYVSKYWMTYTPWGCSLVIRPFLKPLRIAKVLMRGFIPLFPHPTIFFYYRDGYVTACHYEDLSKNISLAITYDKDLKSVYIGSTNIVEGGILSYVDKRLPPGVKEPLNHFPIRMKEDVKIGLLKAVNPSSSMGSYSGEYLPGAFFIYDAPITCIQSKSSSTRATSGNKFYLDLVVPSLSGYVSNLRMDGWSDRIYNTFYKYLLQDYDKNRDKTTGDPDPSLMSYIPTEEYFNKVKEYSMRILSHVKLCNITEHDPVLDMYALSPAHCHYASFMETRPFRGLISFGGRDDGKDGNGKESRNKLTVYIPILIGGILTGNRYYLWHKKLIQGDIEEFIKFNPYGKEPYGWTGEGINVDPSLDKQGNNEKVRYIYKLFTKEPVVVSSLNELQKLLLEEGCLYTRMVIYKRDLDGIEMEGIPVIVGKNVIRGNEGVWKALKGRTEVIFGSIDNPVGQELNDESRHVRIMGIRAYGKTVDGVEEYVSRLKRV